MRGILLALLICCWSLDALALDLFVRGPRPGEPLFGKVEVRLEVLAAAPIESVEIHLDGVLAARLVEPPWEIAVDVGQENREHIFEFIARDVEGDEARRTLTTPAIETHDILDLGLQQLYVTVTRDGARVLDLEQDAFAVLDGKAAQELVTFARGDVPLAAALLVDASASMRGERLRSALAGAEAFVRGMHDLDEAKLLLFSDRPLAQTAFTADPATLEPVLAQAEANSGGVDGAQGTAINDHLYVALEELERRQGRRVVILLSDGIDVESALRMEDVLWKAGRVSALVYWIRLQGPANAPGARTFSRWRDAAGHRRELDGLEHLVQRSGGRILDLQTIADAPRLFTEILAELREQYVLGYYPAVRRGDGSWRAVEVRVRAPGVRVRAPRGYVDAE